MFQDPSGHLGVDSSALSTFFKPLDYLLWQTISGLERSLWGIVHYKDTSFCVCGLDSPTLAHAMVQPCVGPHPNFVLGC